MSRDLDSISFYYLFLEVVLEFGTKFLLRYVNSPKTLSRVNYVNFITDQGFDIFIFP